MIYRITIECSNKIADQQELEFSNDQQATEFARARLLAMRAHMSVKTEHIKPVHEKRRYSE